MEPLYSGHPWGTTLAVINYRGGQKLFIWDLGIPGRYTEVHGLYSGVAVKRGSTVYLTPRVKEADVGRLFAGRELLGKEVLTRMTLKFIVEGQDEGIYSAVIATYEDGDVFYLDAVYRKQAFENRAKLNIGLPGQ